MCTYVLSIDALLKVGKHTKEMSVEFVAYCA
jgi:hypothetical protein